MYKEDFGQKIDALLEHLNLEERQLLINTSAGLYLLGVCKTLAPEIAKSIRDLSKMKYMASREEDIFKLHREIVRFLQLKDFDVDPAEIDSFRDLFESDGDADPGVRLFLHGGHPVYNAGTYAAYFGDWQLREFMKAAKPPKNRA